MTNPYFNYTAIVSHALGRASTLNSQLAAVEAGFDLVGDAIVGVSTSTSTTTHTIAGSGSLAFTLSTGSFSIGQFLLFADTTTPANWMLGQVTDFDSDTLVVTVSIIDSGGSGSISSWTISLVPPGYESAYFQDVLDLKANVAAPTHTGLMTLEGNSASTARLVSLSAIDCSTGHYFHKTAVGALTWTFTNVPLSGLHYAFILELTNGGLGTQTFPAGVTTPSGDGLSFATAGLDMVRFSTRDGGTTWRAVTIDPDTQ